MPQFSRSPQPPRPLRPALAVALALALLPCPAVHAVEVQPAGLNLPRLSEILSPLVDLVSHTVRRPAADSIPTVPPQGDEGSGLDPDGATRPQPGKSATHFEENPRLNPPPPPPRGASGAFLLPLQALHASNTPPESFQKTTSLSPTQPEISAQDTPPPNRFCESSGSYAAPMRPRTAEGGEGVIRFWNAEKVSHDSRGEKVSDDSGILLTSPSFRRPTSLSSDPRKALKTVSGSSPGSLES